MGMHAPGNMLQSPTPPVWMGQALFQSDVICMLLHYMCCSKCSGQGEAAGGWGLACMGLDAHRPSQRNMLQSPTPPVWMGQALFQSDVICMLLHYMCCSKCSGQGEAAGGWGLACMGLDARRPSQRNMLQSPTPPAWMGQALFQSDVICMLLHYMCCSKCSGQGGAAGGWGQ